MAESVIIVGAGLAGLTCATKLQEEGIPFTLVDADDRPGGRLKTDHAEGFLLDRGFQVLFTAYPTVQRSLNLPKLRLRPFRAGALIYKEGKLNLIDRGKPLAMAATSFIPFGDKVKIVSLTRQALGMTLAEIRAMPDMTTEEHLREFGFSDEFIENFARPFFGGVFLDRSLSTSRRMFTFLWKTLAEGDTVLPAGGMEAIPKQLASALPTGSLRMNAPVEALIREEGQVVGVRFVGGEELRGTVVLATDPETAARLVGIDVPKGRLSSTALYFDAPVACVEDAYIVLRGPEPGRVNEVVPMSNVAPEYAPEGRHLICVTLLGLRDESDEELVRIVKDELPAWFPLGRVNEWRFLRSYRVPYAQMPQPPGFSEALPGNRGPDGVFLAGEFTTNSSIDGALHSGIDCAQAVVRSMRGAVVA